MKPNTRNFSSFLGAVTVVTALTTGCGGSSDDATAATTEVPTTTLATSTAVAAPTLAWPVLAIGAKSDQVKVLQNLLVAKDVKVSTDGEFGPRTGEALAIFEKQAGLPATGTTTTELWSALVPSVTAASPKSAIRALQIALGTKGYKVPVTGVFDSPTTDGVAQARTDAASTNQGPVGPSDWLLILGATG
jgi:peptidoglycan hydrolase-like protein with peptidoglycan-binding domain